eukprot:CAMPEP_0183371450 /NCGR_PEP_ID=MMETSP0164_2-20130417/105402_1 /TAXON_ID=221442 /ORGANISM="Coccolithus pelagicus ssp braarudi, Strain PLY182g" /LENGTH=52 /DNA_ID=CAMNT_0025547997 /DNA_START=26 /DNA_END=180 /DNA_ORIENTATION=-
MSSSRTATVRPCALRALERPLAHTCSTSAASRISAGGESAADVQCCKVSSRL